MSESFLHYVWQFQYFARTDLRTTAGEEIILFHPGFHNTHSGPDFSQARIRIDAMEWVGSVEIHILASGWTDHHHDSDPAYDNVILHVVWKNDKPVYRNDGSVMPTLELKPRVDELLILNYKDLVNSLAQTPCEMHLPKVSSIIKLSMLDKATASRLEIRTQHITELMQANNADWEETCFQLLARNFGFRVNAEPFMMLAKNLSFKMLLKHADKIVQLEAFLFGQAGFLEERKGDEYYRLLKREYNLLSQKYSLRDKKLSRAQWRFLRMRPANFPTIRLAQLSMLIHRQRNIFSRIISAADAKTLIEILSVRQSEYWLEHFRFMKKGKYEIASLGTDSIFMIIMNTVVPLLVAYGKQRDEQHYIERAIRMLQEIPAESNATTRHWERLGMKATSAFDSQGLLELNDNFCLKRRCLDCAIGSYLLKPI